MHFFGLVSLLISFFSINQLIKAQDKCDCSCGFIPEISFSFNGSCSRVGQKSRQQLTITWDDGSYSDTMFVFYVQSVVGSCCSFINIIQNATGVITGGIDAGQPATLIISYQDNKPECLSCLTKSRIGVSHFSGLAFLEIGSPSSGNVLKRCKGTIDLFFSPAVTPALQPITLTYGLRFNECTNCTDAC